MTENLGNTLKKFSKKAFNEAKEAAEKVGSLKDGVQDVAKDLIISNKYKLVYVEGTPEAICLEINKYIEDGIFYNIEQFIDKKVYFWVIKK